MDWTQTAVTNPSHLSAEEEEEDLRIPMIEEKFKKEESVLVVEVKIKVGFI